MYRLRYKNYPNNTKVTIGILTNYNYKLRQVEVKNISTQGRIYKTWVSMPRYSKDYLEILE